MEWKSQEDVEKALEEDEKRHDATVDEQIEKVVILQGWVRKHLLLKNVRKLLKANKKSEATSKRVFDLAAARERAAGKKKTKERKQRQPLQYKPHKQPQKYQKLAGSTLYAVCVKFNFDKKKGNGRVKGAVVKW